MKPDCSSDGTCLKLMQVSVRDIYGDMKMKIIKHIWMNALAPGPMVQCCFAQISKCQTRMTFADRLYRINLLSWLIL